MTIRVMLPQHLRTLAHVGVEVQLDVDGPVTQRSVLDALEAAYPMLRGTIRDHTTLQRRPFYASSRANRICRTNRQMPRCLIRSHRDPSRCLSSARLPAARNYWQDATEA